MLLSDYDGTLTPIVLRPEEAVLSPEVKATLTVMAKKPTFSVGIISGRSLPEIMSLVAIEGIYYAGNHGFEIEGPGLKFLHPAAQAARVEIRELVRQLLDRLGDIKGVIVEDKVFSLSVHYRLVSADEESKVAEMFRVITSLPKQEEKIRITSGKKVWEVRPPVDWHKGKAVETIKDAIPGSDGALVIYLGDDRTDEDAFSVVHRLQGWGIFVGAGTESSRAGYYLESTAEVVEFLARLLAMK